MIKRAIVFGVVAFAGSLVAPAPAPAATRSLRTFGGTPPVTTGNASRHYFQYAPAALVRLGVRYLGPANFGRRGIHFTVDTAMRNAAGLRAYATAANSPGSVYYRRWLTPAAIAESFGTPASDYAAAGQYFQNFGLAVQTWPMRTSLAITGTQAQVEAALGTKFGTFELRGSRFYLPARAMSLPANLAVGGISAITNAHMMHTDLIPGGPAQPISGSFSNTRIEGATPQMLANAYDLNTAYAKGYTGKGINLGVIGTGPISAADVPNYKSLFAVKGSSTVTQVDTTSAVATGDSSPPPVTGPCTAGTSTAPVAGCNPEDIEAQLDTEQTASLAPDANVLFYLGYNAANDTQGIGMPDDEVDQAIADDKADILSLSYGACELLEATPEIGILTPSTNGTDATGHDPTEFAELATEGIATFVASGDSGSAGCQRSTGMLDTASVGYPSSDPNVVAVGGATTPIGPDGRLTGPIINWGQATKSGGAAGAGISTQFNTPPYETGQASSKAICVKPATDLSGGGRCNPDVALDADPYTGAAVLYDSGSGIGPAMESPIGGTSQAAPDMAAMWAVVLSACEQVTSCQGPQPVNVVDPVTGYTAPPVPRYRLGNPNYLLYPLLGSAKYHSVFYDITYGDDAVPPYAAQAAASEESAFNDYTAVDPGSVSAGPGFDNASGIGFPEGYELLKALIPGAN